MVLCILNLQYNRVSFICIVLYILFNIYTQDFTNVIF
jgi:hypothetical protein